VTDHDSGSAGSTGESAAVTKLGLDIGNNCAFWHLVDGENVADIERSFGAAIDEFASVHAFDSDEKLSVLLEFVLVSENDFSEGSASAGVVHNILNDSLDVTFTLSEVQGSEGCGCDSLRGVGLEDGAATTSLHSDYSSHD